jgi:tripartite-type tricarboxylate transporter receptor subunit TctC
MRIQVVLIFAATAAFATSASAQAPAYPVKPIRMIVPYPAGGPTDIVARLVAQRLTDAWGQQVVADNRGGANGVIAQDIAAKSAPDGYTVFVHSVAFVVNSLIYKVPYDNQRDFIPVTLVVSFPLMLVTSPAVPAKTVKELVALAKASPGRLNYASYGQGSIAQLAAELFKIGTGTEIVHILYKGAPQAIADVMAGQVQMSFPSVALGLPHMKTGRLRGLAVTSRTRSPLMPDVPTMIEAGIPDYEANSWFGTFFPAGTPPPLIARLHAEMLRIVKISAVKENFDNQAFDIVGLGPDEFARFIRSETQKYDQVVRIARIKVE